MSVPATIQLKWTKEQLTLIKNTVAKGLDDNQFALFIYVCKRTGLDPFLRQIYAIPRWNAKDNRFDITIQVGIDGLRLAADRSGNYAGSDIPEFIENPDNPGQPLIARVTVWKMIQNQRVAFTGEARWAEFAQSHNGKFTGKWADMGHNQLAKCAEAQAIRKGFPADVQGLVSHDEMPAMEKESARQEEASRHPQAVGLVPGQLYSGILAAVSPGEGKRRPTRLTVEIDQQGSISMTTWDKHPNGSTLEYEACVGKRIQVSYEEKPNPKGGEPYRNLGHFAFEPSGAVLKEEPKEEPKENALFPTQTIEDYIGILKSTTTAEDLESVASTIHQETAKASAGDRMKLKAVYETQKASFA